MPFPSLEKQNLANQVTSTYTYNGRGFLMGLTSKDASNAVLSQFTSAPDALDNPASLTASIFSAPTLGGSTTYTPDTKEQLRQESSCRGGGAGYNYSFVYDPAGNPTTFRGGVSPGYTASSNAKNQNQAFTYDGNGSPTANAAGQALGYDYQNRLNSVGSTGSASYNGEWVHATLAPCRQAVHGDRGNNPASDGPGSPARNNRSPWESRDHPSGGA